MTSVQDRVRNFVRRHPLRLVLLLILLSWPAWEVAQEVGTYFSQKAQARDLEQAQRAWDERPFSRYRLIVDYTPLGNRGSQQIIEVDSEQIMGCQQIFEFEDERLEEEITNICKSPETITNIFDSIEEAILKPQCGPNGCRCDGSVHHEYTYNLQNGYPTRISRDVKHDWKTIPWLPLLFLPLSCHLIGSPPPSEITVSLTPF